jgi:argininosuccinate lyase
MMKGLPLAYNKDMQEDKEAIFDAVDTVSLCLPIFTRMISTMKVKPSAMRRAADGGFTNATDLADYLVRKGMPFRDSHAIIGRMVSHCIGIGAALGDLPLDVLKSFSALIENDVYDAISMETCVGGRNVPGGPARGAVLASIGSARARLGQ